MTLLWGSTGVGEWQEVTLSADRRRQVDDILAKREITAPDRGAAFHEAIDEALRNFRRELELAKASSPKAVREKLKNARSAAVAFQTKTAAVALELMEQRLTEQAKTDLIGAAAKLKVALYELDGNSRQLLRHVTAGEIFDLFDEIKSVLKNADDGVPELSTNTVKWLSAAAQIAKSYPMRGRLPEHRRLFLAADVADAMETHLRQRATGTREALFEDLLSVILADAVGKAEDSSDVHSLIERALKQPVKLKNPDGTIEYVPD